MAIFLLFFVFCGTLNFLPFRTIDLAGSRSGLLAGMMYFGYITGIATSMGAGKLIVLTGSKARVMIGGYMLFVVALLSMLVPNTMILFILLFPFCGTMFLVHSVATAVVNSRAEGNRGVASALYVSSYYSGGVAGSYFPGLIFNGLGWGTMVVILACFGLLGTVLLFLYFRNSVHE
jgi:YNFM family putative membrane transporter